MRQVFQRPSQGSMGQLVRSYQGKIIDRIGLVRGIVLKGK